MVSNVGNENNDAKQEKEEKRMKNWEKLVRDGVNSINAFVQEIKGTSKIEEFKEVFGNLKTLNDSLTKLVGSENLTGTFNNLNTKIITLESSLKNFEDLSTRIDKLGDFKRTIEELNATDRYMQITDKFAELNDKYLNFTEKHYNYIMDFLNQKFETNKTAVVNAEGSPVDNDYATVKAARNDGNYKKHAKAFHLYYQKDQSNPSNSVYFSPKGAANADLKEEAIRLQKDTGVSDFIGFLNMEESVAFVFINKHAKEISAQLEKALFIDMRDNKDKPIAACRSCVALRDGDYWRIFEKGEVY